jgi:protein tyrosine phosphatase (PTP) superfamily phosphohydrolase (DUF442 family)
MVVGRTPSLVLLALVTLGAISQQQQGGSPGDQREQPERIDAPGIENVFRLSPRLLSGGQPEGEKGFETLKRLGVRTVISVDGSQPDAEAARRYGLRYVHLPVGYDGIPREQAIRLIAAIRDLTGPVFVHCHHGKQRRPAAAAVCALATEGWDKAQARAWLERAGTDPRYKGLFATVEGFASPSVGELERIATDQLPERAEVPALVETMVEVDHIWDRLREIEKAGFRTPKDSPDLDPPHEVLMLVEQFREASRHEEVKAKGESFARSLATAARDATSLEAALREFASSPGPTPLEKTKASFARVSQDCTTCHTRFRDNRN